MRSECCTGPAAAAPHAVLATERRLRAAWGPRLRVTRAAILSLLFIPLAQAAQLPSLFRGIVVADSPLGVRVVSVEEYSQAHLADLRTEDVIVQVRGTEVNSIDEFAAVSQALTGKTVSVPVLVFRNGAPVEITITLYSYPVLKAWGVRFVPDYNIRFVDQRAGSNYWFRMGRAFEDEAKPAEALNSYLNALHNQPDQPALALKASAMFSAVSRERLSGGATAEGIMHLRQSLSILERAFEYPLSEAQLDAVRTQLRETLQALRQATLTGA